MKREDYEDYYKKINLSDKQKDILLEKIEEDYLYFNANSNLEIEGFSEVFNILYWLFLGDLDTKDAFYDDEFENVLSVTLINDLEIEKDKKEIIESFHEELTSILSICFKETSINFFLSFSVNKKLFLLLSFAIPIIR